MDRISAFRYSPFCSSQHELVSRIYAQLERCDINDSNFYLLNHSLHANSVVVLVAVISLCLQERIPQCTESRDTFLRLRLIAICAIFLPVARRHNER